MENPPPPKFLYCTVCGYLYQPEQRTACPQCAAIYSLGSIAQSRTLFDFIRNCTDTARRSGWHQPPEQSFGEFIALCHSELSEALEGYRENAQDKHLPHLRSQDVELADVLIRIFDYCGYHQIDIVQVLLEKMHFNQTRPWRHGSKVL